MPQVDRASARKTLTMHAPDLQCALAGNLQVCIPLKKNKATHP